MGTVGGGQFPECGGKAQRVSAAVEVSAGKVPVIVGVSDLPPPRRRASRRDANGSAPTGLMVLPAMVYMYRPRGISEYPFSNRGGGVRTAHSCLYKQPPPGTA